tara:strand:+ start:471 stop:743 length:273 start_codon:yes stop_codon:yes gene_type:complete
MENRKEFISRMAWMMSEIDESKFKTLNSLSMLEFHLRRRELDLLNQTKELIINSMEYRANKRLRSGIEISLGKLIIHTHQEFDDIIKKLE